MSIIIDGTSGISTAGGTPIVNTTSNPTALGTVTSITSIGNVSVTAAGYGIAFPDASLQTTVGYTGFRNRIINGAMVIDQRNAGASGIAGSYTVDRWAYFQSATSKGTWQQNAGSVTPPVGFTKYLGFTSSSSYSIAAGDIFMFRQFIEGFNTADLGWGTASAKTVTLSFQVYSSLTGTFGGSINNGDNTRSYPFSYTVSTANTWVPINITIAGATTGTWATDNTAGIQVIFGFGVGTTYSGTAGAWAGAAYYSATGATSVVGTNGATFYLTGVQLEKGSVATPFEFRNYSTELQYCQRYCCNVSVGFGVATSATAVQLSMQYPVTMRAGPSSVTAPQGTARVTDMIAADFTSSAPAPSVNNGDQNGTRITINGFSGMTSGRATMMLQSGASAAPIQFSAEL